MITQYPKLVELKMGANEMTTIEWNPGMDLLATIYSNGTLTCSRLLSLRKVWTKPSVGRLISIAWRPDGRVLAVGAYNEKTKENVCTMHDVEDGKEINSIALKCDITSVEWFSCSAPGDDQPTKEDPIKEKKIFATPVEPTTNENFSHQLAHDQVQLNILMIATSDGVVSFYALGLFYLGSLLVYDEPNSKIIRTHMSSCMRYISAIVSTRIANHTPSTLRVFQLETFQQRSNEILKVSKMYAKITDEIEYLEDTLNAITTSWTDVLAGLDNKLSSYCSRKSQKPNESHSGYTFISADDLLQLLVLGYPSDNLEKLLADMSDKGLRKLNSAIAQTCLRVQNLIVKNAQKCCYHLHEDLNYLRGMSLWREKFKDIGLDDKPIVKAMQDVGSLMLKLTELQQVIDHSLKSTKSFFRWLISIACRLSGEQNNNSSVPNDINKMTQQDIQLITDFILENFDYDSSHDDLTSFLARDVDETGASRNYSVRPTCSNFTLEQVGQYLKNEPLSRLKYSFNKPGSNFWIEFFRSRPEIAQPKILKEDDSLVPLFYPHNPETSLVQEHKKAIKSVESAFKSIADNMDLILENTQSITYLRDFLRNSPAQRIRVETDISLMKHYTLFQTRAGLVPRQYLIAQSLVDKSFKLISIEFQTVSMNLSRQSSSRSSSSNIMITDSQFYRNKASRKMLLSFLLIDQSKSNTLMVQVELNKVVENPVCVDRNHLHINKIFRSVESIEKQSSQVVLRLDINSEPAHERRHDPEMMVKKIKGTVGQDMFTSSSRGVIAFTSCKNKRTHLYELEVAAGETDIVDDEVEADDKVDDSLMDAEFAS